MSGAASATNRSRVLGLYKQILKLAKNWKAKDAERTLIERKDIVNEAKQTFRENKKVTDPNKIAELVLEAEKRIVQAEHYGIPYDRPDYVEPQTAYNVNIARKKFKKVAQTFIRRYFAGSKISEEIVDDLVKLCSSEEIFYQNFVKRVLCNKLLEKYPIRTSYKRNLLKVLIKKLEHSGVEVLDEIYDICASAMIDTADYSYRIFLSDDFSQLLIVLRESNQQLCYGTTGLSLWQASCDLANLLCRFVDLSSKNVLELGAGCGLAGIAIARTFSDCNVILSDYDPKVLNQLKYNVEANLIKDCTHVKVLNLDWTTFSAVQLPELPDVVVAADVVYDCSILPALCGVLRTCIYAKQGCCAFIASTLRDPLTLQSFKNCLDASDLQVEEELRYQYEKYTFSDGSRFRCTTFFPHSSTLDAPTIIYKVVRKT